MFRIDRNDLAGIGWLRPGLLLLARMDSGLTFFDTAARVERFHYHTGLWYFCYLDPRTVVSGDGRWLVFGDSFWDLEPTVTALASGADPVPPRLVPEARRESAVIHDFAFDRPWALRWDLAGQHRELVELPSLAVVAPCPEARYFGYPAVVSARHIVYPDEKDLLLFDLATGDLRHTLMHTQDVHMARFSPDARLLATAAGVTVRVWDVDSGQCLTRFKGQRGHITSFAFHPSGRFLAVGCPDETVRFWDVGGTERARFAWNAGRIRFVTFSPDGLTAAAHLERAVVIWDVDG